jgi:hypothetical protein
MVKHDMRIGVAGIWDASSLVGNGVAIREGTLWRNVAFGNCPALAADGVHGHIRSAQVSCGAAAEEILQRQVGSVVGTFGTLRY